jgi:anti-sigma regulatory factor (Ser/Thr protein kinase)
MALTFRLHVPCDVQHTELVEEFIRFTTKSIFSKSAIRQTELCAAINEIFTNIIIHSHTARIDQIVRFQVDIGKKIISISVFDNGPGFKIKKQLPPYDTDLIGYKQELKRVIDGRVMATVIDNNTVAFTFEESQNQLKDRLAILKTLNGHGLGISIITKIMDSLRYKYLGEGKFDWQMKKQIAH